MLFAILPVFMVLWLVGGQINKAARRYAAPLLATTLALGYRYLRRRDKWWVGALILLYIPILSLGYGTDSWLRKVVRAEWVVRLVYALACCVPLGIIALCTGHYIRLVIAAFAVVSVFQIRAGRLFSLGNFEVLVEDLARSLVLGSSIAWSLA